ncbi:MAG: ribosome small subunit-dependent GTPase A [Bacteroidaceae bacterium]
MHGIVVRNTGGWYIVRKDDGQTIECKVKGNFRLKGIRSTSPVAVGDSVRIIENNEGTAFISHIDDRKNYIIRKASNLSKQSHILAANMDQVMLIVTIKYPETATTFIDRFLATAEAYRIPVSIVFNKVDRYNDEESEAMHSLTALYEHLGYPCYQISALKREGMDLLYAALKDKTTLLSGNSGVGKSTLLNALIPDLNVKTAEISAAHNTGMHTTTFSELFDIPDGGALIDIPGIKGFGTFDIERNEVAHYFREIFEISSNCKYNNCIHIHEPGCAVLQALDDHKIALSRYTSYLSMLEDKEEGKYRAAY